MARFLWLVTQANNMRSEKTGYPLVEQTFNIALNFFMITLFSFTTYVPDTSTQDRITL